MYQSLHFKDRIRMCQESQRYMGAYRIAAGRGNWGKNHAAQLKCWIHKGGSIKAGVKTQQLSFSPELRAEEWLPLCTTLAIPKPFQKHGCTLIILKNKFWSQARDQPKTLHKHALFDKTFCQIHSFNHMDNGWVSQLQWMTWGLVHTQLVYCTLFSPGEVHLDCCDQVRAP